MRTLNKLLACAMALVVPLCTWAQTETEPNNSSGAANPVAYNTAMAGSSGVCAPTDNTVDYFTFTPPAQGVLRINTSMSNSGAGDVNVTLQLRDAATNVIATYVATSGGSNNALPNQFTFPCQGTGAYFLNVNNPGFGVCINYSFTYDIIAPAFGNDAEPNNSSGGAVVAGAGVDHDGHVGFRYDVNADYFRLQAPTDGVMSVSVQAEHASTSTTDSILVRLRDVSTNVLVTWKVGVGANGIPNGQTLTRTCVGTEQVYFLEFPSPTPCGVSYRFNYAVAQPIYADDLEPNQSSGAAIIANANTNYDGRVDFDYDNDFDYFRLQAPTDGVMSVTIQAENAGASAGTMTLYLRDASTNVIETWTVNVGANGVPASNTFIHRCTGTEQQYYLEPDNPTVCGVSYRFSYTVAAPVFADDSEPNQSSGAADTALVGIDYDGRLDFRYDNDFDYFRLQAPTDGVMNVTIQAENAGPSVGTMTLYLRDQSTNVIETWTVNIGANGTSVPQTFSHTCTGTEQVYFLEPDNPTVCGVSYRFSYTVTPPVFADDLEPNQSSGAAIVANANTNYDGRVEFDYDNNFDYFRLQAPTDGVMSVTIQAEHAGTATGATMTLYLRDASTNVIETWTVNIGANGIPVSNTFTHLCTGTEQVYFLEPDNPSVCGTSYRFTYSVAAPVFADDAEPNQSSGQALNIDLNAAPADGRVEFEYDNNFDYFRINHLGGPIVLNTQAEAAGAAGTMQILIRDASTNVLVTPVVPVGGGSVPVANTYTSPAYGAGIYYIEPFNPTSCGTSYRFDCYDTDADGTCNAFDLCPGGPEPGTACNDNDPCTTGDVIQAGCNCAGTFQDSDSDGTCDFNDLCPGGPEPGTACNDNNVCTTGDVIGANCLCAGTFQDADGDGTCDANDLCPGGPEPGAACNDNNVCTTGDVIGANCLCAGTFADADADGTCDANDLCPGGPEPGTGCNDNNGATINDIIQANCLCAGTLLGNDCNGVPGGPAGPGTPCNDNNACTTGDVFDANCLCAGTFADADADGTCDANDLCAGGPEPGTACNDNNVCTTGDVIGANCLCAGTFADADADGTCDANDLCAGGPEPGTACNDNNVCTTGDVIGANCLCAGTFQDADADGTCDANDLCAGGPEPGTACNDNNVCTTGDVIGANCLCAGTFADADADGTCDANDLCAGGPEPGTGCNDNNANTNNDVIDANCVCAGTPIGGGCQPTQLTTTADPIITCGLTNVKLDGTTTLWAYEVPGANKYQFLFTNIPGQPAYNRSIAGPTRSRQLFKWYTTPLKAGRTYRVKVRASFDNGTTWCAYDAVCNITISNNPNAQFRDLEDGDELSDATVDQASLQLFPNPVRDGRLSLNMTGLDVIDETPVSIEVFDAMGRRVHTEQAAAAAGTLDHVMQLNGSIGKGLYLVHIVVDGERYTERLIVN